MPRRSTTAEPNAQPHAVQWPTQLVGQLGKRPDREIAKLAGCSIESVRRERARRKIGPHRPTLRWTDKLVALLGKRPDAEVARIAGCSINAVEIERCRLGIPARP